MSYSHKERVEEGNTHPQMDRPNNKNTSTPGEYYRWQPEGQPIAVDLQYGIVDKLLIEIMKGFGSVPRRGAEVGGLLLGTSENTDGKVNITVREFQPVACEHAGGPSFTLSEKDMQGFVSAVEQNREGLEVVGQYRSHTREGLGMSNDDIHLMDQHLPGDGKILLLVKPFATRVSSAGIFFRENGEFLRTDASHLEFPFRRKELGGGSSGTERIAAAARFGQTHTHDAPLPFPGSVRQPRSAATATASQQPMEAQQPFDPQPNYEDPRPTQPPPPPFAGLGQSEESYRPKRESNLRSGWVWIPLSLIFLVFGVLLGFQTALNMRPNGPAALGPEIFNLSLTIVKVGDSLNVTWDRQAAAVRTAGHGVLHIKDGDFNKSLPLDATELQVGSVVYRKPSASVNFKLEVFPRDRTIVSESVEYKEAP